jgi:hypothetical protein
MTDMDTTPGPDDISELIDVDPAEAPEIADRIVDRLSLELDPTEDSATDEEPSADTTDEVEAVD